MGDEGRMVSRDACNEGYHMWCVTFCLDGVLSASQSGVVRSVGVTSVHMFVAERYDI